MDKSPSSASAIKTKREPHKPFLTFEVSDDGRCVTVFNSYTVDTISQKALFVIQIVLSLPAMKRRSLASYVREWQAHNILYGWGLFKNHTKDVDLEVDESWIRRLGYYIITKLFRERSQNKKRRIKKV